jgi:hypothetical protein
LAREGGVAMNHHAHALLARRVSREVLGRKDETTSSNIHRKSSDETTSSHIHSKSSDETTSINVHSKSLDETTSVNIFSMSSEKR